MPSRRTKRFPAQRGRGIQLSASTRHAKRASECEHPPSLSPPDSGCGTERSKAAGQRSGSLVAATWSEVQQTANGRSQANPRRQSACAGAWAKWKPSLAGCEPHLPPEKRSRSAGIVHQAAQSADGSCVVRRVLRKHLPRHQSASEARSAVRAAPAVTPFSRSGALACLAIELCRECSGVVAPWTQTRCEKRSGMDVPAQVVESGPNATASPVRALSARPRGSGLAL